MKRRRPATAAPADATAEPSHGPIRTCVGCGRKAAAVTLLRVVRAGDGALVPGRPGRDGRGAWLCPGRPECLDAAVARGFARAFRKPIRRSDVTALRAIMAGRGRMESHARVLNDGHAENTGRT